MDLSDLDFALPPELIALRPAEPRDAARLLEVGADGALDDRCFADLAQRLRPGDLVVFNDTRVLAARLRGVRRRESGPPVAIEATLHRRLAPSRWTAFARPGRRLALGDRIAFGETGDRACLLGVLDATVTGKAADGEVTLAFDLAGADLDLAVAERGVMPLPPYIASRRPEDEQDRSDYQTCFARHDGSVAAPTAGLHFTAVAMEALAERGVGAAFVTLHVGAGTFLPLKSLAGALHAEWGRVEPAAARSINAARAAGGRIVCIGTTALRLIESTADPAGRAKPFEGETSLFIKPGYRFRLADALVTNFHLPRSSLFALTAAFCGLERMRAAYAHAITERYRFYSYGDACLLWRA